MSELNRTLFDIFYLFSQLLSFHSVEVQAIARIKLPLHGEVIKNDILLTSQGKLHIFVLNPQNDTKTRGKCKYDQKYPTR